jgi:hypothetical protein
MAEDSEASDKRLNNLVAVTVVIVTVFLAVSNVKGGNIGQAMQQAQALYIDSWNEYQASRIKLHVDENALATLRLLEADGGINKEAAAKQAAEYEADIKKYQLRSQETIAKAKASEAEYQRLNVHDDQFDVSEAFLQIALAVAAIAALIESYFLLGLAWVSGAVGILFGTAGFLGWRIGFETASRFLGA